MGEVRGEEASILFQAMNTGHIVYSTMHAADVGEAVTRLTSPPLKVPISMLSPLDVVVVQSLIEAEGVAGRRCVKVYEVEGVDAAAGSIRAKLLFEWKPREDCMDRVGELEAVSKFLFRKGMTRSELLEELDYRSRRVEAAIGEGISGYAGFLSFLRKFYEAERA